MTSPRNLSLAQEAKPSRSFIPCRATKAYLNHRYRNTPYKYDPMNPFNCTSGTPLDLNAVEV